MKQAQIILILVLGLTACLVDHVVLSNVWAGLGWRGPIAEWIHDLGFGGVAGVFGVFWIRIPTFMVAGVLGFAVAHWVPEHWRTAAFLGWFGFVGTSVILTAWFAFAGYIGWASLLKAQALSLPSLPLLLLAAWYSAKKQSYRKSVV